MENKRKNVIHVKKKKYINDTLPLWEYIIWCFVKLNLGLFKLASQFWLSYHAYTSNQLYLYINILLNIAVICDPQHHQFLNSQYSWTATQN